MRILRRKYLEYSTWPSGFNALQISYKEIDQNQLSQLLRKGNLQNTAEIKDLH